MNEQPAKSVSTQPRAFVFVLMPFSESFNDIYGLGIRPACERAGAYCERVDEQVFQGSVLQRIYNQIGKADVIIADMSGQNPNVFYEVGYAHALGKQVILATQRTEDIPFDLRHYPHVVYAGKITYLQSELEKRVAWCLAHPETPQPDTSGLQFFLRQQQILENAVIVYRTFDPVYDYDRINISFGIHNASSRSIDLSYLEIGLVLPIPMSRLLDQAKGKVARIFLEDGRVMFFISPLGKIPPNGWRSAEIEVDTDTRGMDSQGIHELETMTRKDQDCEVRLFSEISESRIVFRLRFCTPASEARSALKSGNLSEALGHFRIILEVAPDNRSANYNSACIYSRLGNKDAALECLRKAVAPPSYEGEKYCKLAIQNDDFRDLCEDATFNSIVDSCKEGKDASGKL